jgi:hypothetical protein
MIHTKHVLFVVTSFILAALIYSSSPTFDVFVQGKPVVGTLIDCTDADFFSETCCWWEDFGTYIAKVCQTCYADGYGGYGDCDPIEKQRTIKGGDVIPPLEEGVLEQPLTTLTTPTPPPLFGRNIGNAPLAGGVSEQPLTTIVPTTPVLTPPPLFGRNTANVPLGGGVLGQPTITAATPTPIPTPIPTPTPFGQIAPEGQVLPPTGDEGLTGIAPRIVEPPPICTPGSVLDPNINECVLENPPQLCPDGSIPKSTGPGGTRPECPPFETEEPEVEDPDQPETQQPETQQPQDNEEVGPPNEGQDTTAGSLT